MIKHQTCCIKATGLSHANKCVGNIVGKKKLVFIVKFVKVQSKSVAQVV